mgnify:CR=1 FL=1
MAQTVNLLQDNGLTDEYTPTQRIAELQARRKTLDLEMEFYRKDPAKAPMLLRRQLAENDEGVQEQRRFIAGQDQEKRRVHQRFDAELAQLQKLWAQQRELAGSSEGAAVVPR